MKSRLPRIADIAVSVDRARIARWANLACHLCLYGVALWFATKVGLAALRSGLGLHALPRPLAILDHRLPVVFRLHMLGGGLALLLLPWVLLARHHRPVHRRIGRIAAGAMLVGILASLPSALASVATPAARAGFFVQGVLCLGLLLAALLALAAGNVARHRRLMAYVAALISGAVVLRLMLMVAVMHHLPFARSYAAIAWLSWLLPLTLVWAWPQVCICAHRAARRCAPAYSAQGS